MIDCEPDWTKLDPDQMKKAVSGTLIDVRREINVIKITGRDAATAICKANDAFNKIANDHESTTAEFAHALLALAAMAELLALAIYLNHSPDDPLPAWYVNDEL